MYVDLILVWASNEVYSERYGEVEKIINLDEKL